MNEKHKLESGAVATDQAVAAPVVADIKIKATEKNEHNAKLQVESPSATATGTGTVIVNVAQEAADAISKDKKELREALHETDAALQAGNVEAAKIGLAKAKKAASDEGKDVSKLEHAVGVKPHKVENHAEVTGNSVTVHCPRADCSATHIAAGNGVTVPLEVHSHANKVTHAKAAEPQFTMGA